jgi:Protein of unknown function (DUF3800)
MGLIESGSMAPGIEFLSWLCRAEWFAFVSIRPVMYCDESETAGKCLVIAGYAASTEEWRRFEVTWREALVDEQLTEFHMQPCLAGDGEFKDRDRGERDLLQWRFIGLVRDANLLGVSSALDLRAYDALRPRFKRVRAHPRANLLSPYYLAFQALLQATVTEVAETTDLSPNERLEFVFDIKDEHSGNSLDIWKELRQKRQRYRDCLAGASFQDSADYPGIQAADILAYEMRKHAINAWSDDPSLIARQQFHELQRKVPVRDTYLNADGLHELVAEWERRLGQSQEDS